ncbi:MAG TPA: hypothetical protein VHT24_12710 [Pseudacidobacterium sp.]|jgi:hypothetical protein|nr:hypothetical protein [Pseudacidobacterium sp.]
MRDLTIDRLSLRLSGMREGEGQRLARMIAEGLAGATVDAGTKNFRSMQSNATAKTGTNLQAISNGVVADLIRQLERSA